MTHPADPILFLHGALGSAEELAPLAAALAPAGASHAMNFPGHGREPFAPSPLSVELLGREVARYLAERELPRVRIVGYSLGGYVGLWLAAYQPARVSCVVTIATKFRWDPVSAAKEAAFLDPATIREKAPSFAASLAARHGEERWETLVRETSAFLLALGAAPALGPTELGQIDQPVLVAVGDSDAMVSVDESAAAADAIPNASLLVLPSTPHPIGKAPTGLLAAAIRGFFDNAH